MNLSDSILLGDPSTAIISEEPRSRIFQNGRQLVRDTGRPGRLVPEHRDPVLKAVRCLYTDVFRREALRISILRQS